MLLLKYPTPEPPNGPDTFVEDAIFLKNNFNPSAGADLIAKYSGKAPSSHPEAVRPSTPGRGERRLKEDSFSRRRSPLPSPAKFIQQQGGVEAFLQGAARGVLARGEKLGINRAVREAVGEVRKNMQGLSQNNSPRRSGESARWSLDDGGPVPPQSKGVVAMEQRNKQLAIMLEDALNDLRKLSASENGEKDSKPSDAIDLVIAKVQFVQVYLEDSAIPLPTEASQDTTSSPTDIPSPRRPSTATGNSHSDISKDKIKPGRPRLASRTASAPPVEVANNAPMSSVAIPAAPDLPPPQATAAPSEPGPETKTKPRRVPERQIPVPTRSSLAQSSFAFMLEPDEQAPSALRSSSPKSSSPFAGSARKPVGARREQSAFLFGEDSEEGEILPRERRESSVQPDTDELFNLTPIKSIGKDA